MTLCVPENDKTSHHDKIIIKSVAMVVYPHILCRLKKSIFRPCTMNQAVAKMRNSAISRNPANTNHFPTF